MNICTPFGLSSLGTSLGLSHVTGYSPYFPLLSLAAGARWFHFCHLNPSFQFVTSNWFMTIVAILAIIDLILDALPAISTVWHGIHVGVSPIIGGFIMAATGTGAIPGFSLQAASTGQNVMGLALHLPFLAVTNGLQLSGAASIIVLFIIGMLAAGIVQTHRALGRTFANIFHIATLGISNVVISLIEDAAALIGILLSFFAPIFMLVVVIVITLFLLTTFGWVRKGSNLLFGGARRGRRPDRRLW
jgi:Domain of unknown function (DUF4126)